MRPAATFVFLAFLAACGGAAPGGGAGSGGIATGGSGGSGGTGGVTGEVKIVAPAEAYAGQLVNMALLNVPDNAVVAWDQMPGPAAGTFTEHASSGAQWYSADVVAPTTYELRATVDSQVYTAMISVRPPHFKAEVFPIFNVCGGNGCHPRGGGDFDFHTASMAYQSLQFGIRVGVCNGPLVVPGDVTSSTLLRKLTGVTCGPRMPELKTRYFDDNKNMLVSLRSWILAGAHND